MSVRKRTWTTGGVEKSSWIVDYTDQHGKRRQKTFAKKKEADAWAARAKTEVGDGLHVADSATITVKQATDHWLKSCEAAGLERSTLAQYEQHCRLHIVPRIGDLKLSKLTVPSVRAFQDKLREDGRSAAMVKRVTVSLGSAVSDAQERGLIIRNPVQELSTRRKGGARPEKRQKVRLQYGIDIPTLDEMRAFLGATEGRYGPLLVTAALTGMRSSELRGLRWSDVDFAKERIHIRQRADAYQVIGMPKSDAGHRTIPLTPLVTNTLKEWRLACPKGELDLVFPNGSGNIEYHANIISRGLHPTMIRAGVKTADGKPRYSGMHALRHWFASWCINRRADGGLELSPKAVQERLGHSSIQITFDTYGHLFPSQDESRALAEAEARLLAVHAT